MYKSKHDEFRKNNFGVSDAARIMVINAVSKPIIVVLALVVLALGIPGSGRGAAETASPLTKQQVKMLIKTAKTPGDHLKLARYYRSEAARLTAEASDYQEMETAYGQNPSSHIIPKWPSMGEHCKNLMDDYAQAAKEATAMADMHEEMSKNPGK